MWPEHAVPATKTSQYVTQKCDFCNLPRGLLLQRAPGFGIMVSTTTDSPDLSLTCGELLLHWAMDLENSFISSKVLSSQHSSLIITTNMDVLLASLPFVDFCTQPVPVKFLWACNSSTPVFSWLLPLLPSFPHEDPTKWCLLAETLLLQFCSLYLWPKAGQKPSHPSHISAIFLHLWSRLCLLLH